MSTTFTFTELRAGSPADLANVCAVMTAAFDARFGEAWTSSQCLGMLALPGVWLTLAYRDDVLVGFAMARAIAGEGELLLLAVHPDRRGSGIGAVLLRSVITDAQTRGTEQLHLEVRADNSAIRLYRAHGFAKVGERRDYYRGSDGRRHDAHTFARKIG